jgi:hypothetical protein
MFVHVTRECHVRLEEAHDFKHFKLVIDAPRAEMTTIVAALTGIASIVAEGHAWVSEDWLRRRETTPPWQDGLDAMIAVAKKYGWVDDAAKTIRAHVEWSSEAPATA